MDGLNDFVSTDTETLKGFLSALLEAREKARDAEDALKAANEVAKNAERSLVSAMAEQGCESFKALGFSIRSMAKQYVSVTAENRGQQMEWLQTIGAGDMIQPTVSASSFGALIRERIRNGEEVPEWVRVFEDRVVGLRSAQ